MKKFLMCLIATFITTGAFAGPKGGCSGTYKGKKIIFNGLMTHPTNTDTAEGSISVGGRIVADFEGEDLKINYIFQTFKVRNNRGALVEGRVNNMFKKTGVISRLYVPEFGIDYRNIPMACWQK